ncbi:putative protein disulfide isomerase-like 1-6-like [Capsicum annuum]|nr:putative protein disulfide isomerase-like 1-6-like [Capsicum annuum]KAF3642835.1 putative protein disulfide isomerase-like 1-6-like [Capsicum annuum]
MAEIGLRLKALTGYAVGVISFLVLAFALLASAEQILNGTSNDFESGSFFKLFNVLLQEGKMHYQHFWPELEFGWRVIVGSVIGFFAAAFGSVGGVGGGGIFVPMLTLITGFDPKTSTAISKCMITGAAGATVYYNLKLRHPILDLPIIDYDLSLLLQPMLLLGISIGVVLNILFAEWMVTVLLIILFIDAGAEDAAYKLLPADPRVRNEGYKTPEVSIVDNVYWKDFIILIAVWVILLVPVAVGASGYEAVCLYKGTRMVMSSGEAVITWKVHQLILYCCCGILAGIVGGLLGLGGGFILGPLFLELGIPPQVSSATATFVMIFSSSMSVVQYYLLGRFPVPYGGVGIADTIKRIKEGRYMGFDNICEYKP